MRVRKKCPTCGCLLINRRSWKHKAGLALIAVVIGSFTVRYILEVGLG